MNFLQGAELRGARYGTIPVERIEFFPVNLVGNEITRLMYPAARQEITDSLPRLLPTRPGRPLYQMDTSVVGSKKCALRISTKMEMLFPTTGLAAEGTRATNGCDPVLK